jgi:uncharacterized protein (TIGR02099 family)
MSLSKLAAALSLRDRPRRARRYWRRALAWGAWLLFAAWSLCLVAWLTLHWGILPRLDDWRPRIEAYASRAIGAQLSIGRIGVRSSGWVPAFELDDVTLRDEHGRTVLALPRVYAALSVPALVGAHLRFEQLLIDGARLDVRRDRQGRIRVAGMDMDGDIGTGADGTALADWFFEQHEFVIRAGALRWVDELRAAPPLALADVQIVVRNGSRRHDLRLDGTPPPSWGQRFTIALKARQPLLARAGDWQRWRGTVHAELPQVAVGELQRHVHLPVELSSGAGAMRAWIDFDQGLPRAATVDLALRDVAVRLAPDLEPLALEHAGGRFTASREAQGISVQAQRFSARTADGLDWPLGDLSLTWQQRQPHTLSEIETIHPVTGGELRIDALDLATTAELAGRLPLGSSVRALLRELQPKGQVQQLQAIWQGPLDAPTHYDVRASVKDMAIAAQAALPAASHAQVAEQPIGRPGWRGADFEFHATDTGGRARLLLDGGALEFPGVFDDPVVPLKRFSAQLNWRIDPPAAGEAGPRISLAVEQARFENADAHGEVTAHWRTGGAEGFGRGARLPGVLEMDGRLAQGLGTRVARYLPLGIPDATRRYVQHAVQVGRVSDVGFRVKGDLWDFPYMHRRDGEFRIAGQVSGVTLEYVPSMPARGAEPAFASPWPAFTDVAGELIFERSSMQIRGARGRLWGVQLSDVQGGIRNLAENPVLEIDGQASGPAADLLRFVNQTPVGHWIGDALSEATASGSADLKLALQLPLDDIERSRVKGSVTLNGSDVRVAPGTPSLGQARGRVEFTHRGVQLAGASAQLYGGEARIDGGSQPDGTLRFNAEGQASGDALARAPELADSTRWLKHLSGQSPYRAQLDIVRGQVELAVTSTLTGMAIALPAPLDKPAAANWPFQLQTRLTPDARDGLGPPRETLDLSLGSVLRARYLRERGPGEPRVLGGTVALGTDLPPMAEDVRAAVDLPQVDLDAWRPLLTASTATPGAPASAADASPGPVARAADADSADSAYAPRSISLRAGELRLASRRLTHVSLDLDRVEDAGAPGWRIMVKADQASGQIDYEEARGATSAGLVRARLTRLSLPRSDAEGVDQLLEQAPATVPALDIRIDDFELRGKHLGRLSVQAVNRDVGGAESAREWRLSKLALDTPEGRLTATGQWGYATGASPRRRMGMDFRLDIDDAGQLLGRLGFRDVLRGGTGALLGQVAWSGSPLALDAPSLEGRMTLALDAGQFLKAEPGVARLLGVLSLQTLPRRLLLDFRDVFQEGFAFDSIGGDLELARGVATTRNMRLRGVQASVLMEGSADIAHETQDLRVRVVPEVNAGTASLAYAAINPVVGLGTFLTQWLLSGALSEANTREFHITGGWSDPKVAPVERAGSSASPAQATNPPQRSPQAQPTAAAASGATR